MAKTLDSVKRIGKFVLGTSAAFAAGYCVGSGVEDITNMNGSYDWISELFAVGAASSCILGAHRRSLKRKYEAYRFKKKYGCSPKEYQARQEKKSGGRE